MPRTYYGKRKYAKKYGKRKYKQAKKTLGKSMAKAVKAVVKREINQVVETKVADYCFTPLGQLTSLYSNSWYRFEADPFTMYQGTSDAETLNPINRIGDTILAKSLSIKINLATYSNTSTVQYRFVVLKLKAGATMPINITSHPQGLNVMINPIDRENPAIAAVICDKKGWMINHGQTSAGGGDGERQLLQFSFKINKKIKYDDGAAANGSFVYAPYIAVFDRQGTQAPICDFQYFRRFYFQDA